MKSPDPRKDPGHTVFGWDEEPSQERPSEWGENSRFESASGYYRGGSVLPTRRQGRRSAGLGCALTLVFVALLVVGVWAAIRWLLPMMHR